LDVDLKGYKFTQPPMVFTSLTGISEHFTVTGVTSIYDLTKDGFRVYMKHSTRNLNLSKASEYQYVLNYIIVPVC
jgi:hypothetical protein